MSNSSFQNSQKWVTGDQVCSILKISKRTLYSYRRIGILPYAQIGRKIYYRASDIDDYLDAHYMPIDIKKGSAA